jgi:hypothetical protein
MFTMAFSVHGHPTWHSGEGGSLFQGGLKKLEPSSMYAVERTSLLLQQQPTSTQQHTNLSNKVDVA